MDLTARDVYRRLSLACADSEPELATAFDEMSHEERERAEWWADVLAAWEAGLVPDIIDEFGLGARILQAAEDARTLEPGNLETLEVDEMLAFAAHLEFYLLDPAFGELAGLMRPGGRDDARNIYARHVMHLIEAVGRYHSDSTMARLLSRMLGRTWRDQVRLADLAVRDPLTGLLNRREVLVQLDQWLAWTRRYDRPLGVALFDVDRFKSVNATYGHRVGDDVLCGVADVIRSCIRAADVLGRFGGDEFIVIAPEADEDSLSKLLARVVDAVEDHPFATQQDRLEITVSAGGAWTQGGGDVGPDRLIADADHSLYEAKSAGRGRAGEICATVEETAL
jgi:diguanylate cyclase (GGDEF)-like protein